MQCLLDLPSFANLLACLLACVDPRPCLQYVTRITGRLGNNNKTAGQGFGGVYNAVRHIWVEHC